MTSIEVSGVGGLDGCTGGWALALFTHKTQRLSFHLINSLSELHQNWPEITVIAVDMPMHLHDWPQKGGRACDQAARALLPPRARASVFSAPTQKTLHSFRSGLDYRALHLGQKAAYPGAPGISKQTYFLLPKISELAVFDAEHHDIELFESHPEVAFCSRGVFGAGPFFSKKTEEGRRLRRAYFRTLGWVLPSYPAPVRGGPRAGEDDWLDAAILARVALRYADGRARHVGTDPSRLYF